MFVGAGFASTGAASPRGGEKKKPRSAEPNGAKRHHRLETISSSTTIAMQTKTRTTM
jgi:hypothetical protein